MVCCSERPTMRSMVARQLRPSVKSLKTRRLSMPSAFFHNMTGEDVDAIITWLRTVPAVENEVEQVDWMTAFGIPQPQ